MGITLDCDVSCSRPRQYVAAIAARIDPGKATLCRVQWSRSHPLNPETEKDVSIDVSRDRRIDEYRGVVTGGTGVVARQVRLEHSPGGTAGAARIGIADEAH